MPELFMYWTDEFDASDILKFLEENGEIEGDDARLDIIYETSLRVGPTRQLGDWIEIDIDATNKRVTCNCEDFNFDGTCLHQTTFEVLQFGMIPHGDHQFGYESWPGIRRKCIGVLKSECFHCSK